MGNRLPKRQPDVALGIGDNVETSCKNDWVMVPFQNGEEKYLKIAVVKLQSFIGYSFASLNELLTNSLSYVQDEGKWEVWPCCVCEKDYSNSESLWKHILLDHVGNQSTSIYEFLSLLGNNTDELIKKIQSSPWKNLDATAAVRIFENQEKTGSITDCLDNIPSNDPDCDKLLLSILERFRTLIGYQFVPADYLLNKVIQFSMDELQAFELGSKLLTLGLGQTPIPLCFMEREKLEKIDGFFMEVCNLERDKGKSNEPSDDYNQSNKIVKPQAMILSDDGLHIFLHEALVPADLTLTGETDNPTMDYVVSPMSRDPVFYTIISKFSQENLLDACLNRKNSNKTEGEAIVKAVQTLFDQIQAQHEEPRGGTSLELNEHDYQIMNTIAQMWEKKLKLGSTLYFNYTAILLPILKIYLEGNFFDELAESVEGGIGSEKMEDHFTQEDDSHGTEINDTSQTERQSVAFTKDLAVLGLQAAKMQQLFRKERRLEEESIRLNFLKSNYEDMLKKVKEDVVMFELEVNKVTEKISINESNKKELAEEKKALRKEMERSLTDATNTFPF